MAGLLEASVRSRGLRENLLLWSDKSDKSVAGKSAVKR